MRILLIKPPLNKNLLAPNHDEPLVQMERSGPGAGSWHKNCFEIERFSLEQSVARNAETGPAKDRE